MRINFLEFPRLCAGHNYRGYWTSNIACQVCLIYALFSLTQGEEYHSQYKIFMVSFCSAGFLEDQDRELLSRPSSYFEKTIRANAALESRVTQQI